MNSIDRNGDGVMDMLPDETRAHLRTVHDAGEQFAVAWSNARAAIANAKIGEGPMGEKFMENYQPSVEAVSTILDKVPDAYRQLANWGYGAVQIYQGADAEAVQEFPRSSQP
ncbi:hypothetical protein GCM10027290_55240 [Micromonospora sonneratiae]|uniref:Excreted virulence factor EspC, type VII ESX diderm n=1 Tax=Micromonospora sonneratiae TaxID=1184706 RepID=A0ABW3YRN6_9ACTN